MRSKFFIFGGLLFYLAICSISIFAQETNPKTINGGVVNGKAISLPKPEYPDEAKKANVGGAVTVQVIIDEQGNVISAKTVSGNQSVAGNDGRETVVEENAERQLLYEAAENAAKQAKFSPTLLDGNPVQVKGVIVYNFVAGRDGGEINGGILNSKSVSLPLPEYPETAKSVKAAGSVMVQVTIDEEGNVISAQAVSGHPLLRDSAVKAARDAKFSPTFLSGKAVKVVGVVVYNFVI